MPWHGSIDKPLPIHSLPWSSPGWSSPPERVESAGACVRVQVCVCVCGECVCVCVLGEHSSKPLPKHTHCRGHRHREGHSPRPSAGGGCFSRARAAHFCACSAAAPQSAADSGLRQRAMPRQGPIRRPPTAVGSRHMPAGGCGVLAFSVCGWRRGKAAMRRRQCVNGRPIHAAASVAGAPTPSTPPAHPQHPARCPDYTRCPDYRDFGSNAVRE